MVFITVFELVSIERNFSACTRRVRHMNGSSKTWVSERFWEAYLTGLEVWFSDRSNFVLRLGVSNFQYKFRFRILKPGFRSLGSLEFTIL